MEIQFKQRAHQPHKDTNKENKNPRNHFEKKNKKTKKAKCLRQRRRETAQRCMCVATIAQQTTKESFYHTYLDVFE